MTSSRDWDFGPTIEGDELKAIGRHLARVVEQRGWWMSLDYRICEQDVAALLGMHPGSLKNMRHAGTAPRAFKVGGNGHRVTYYLADIARYIYERKISGI
jgi:hypothetical protein